MSFIHDFLKMFKKHEITFIKSYKESEDVHTFLFEKNEKVSWVAGQHGLFSIIHKKIKSPLKPFSVASSATENVIQLTMKIGKEPSEYKQAMLELTPGMKMNMIGPVGSFSLQEQVPSVLIAGGIGITPFRSILKQLETNSFRNKQPIHLLYMDSDNSHLYRDELDALGGHSSVSVSYLNTREELHLEIDKVTSLYKNEGKYYVAGPKSMVKSIAEYIQNKQIAKRNIKKDAFFGY